jgi:transcriptional regulator with XRE-family HTH domain
MTLGQKLREARLERGLTQAQAAGGCVTRNMLSQIENDQASPSVKTLAHLAAVLGVGAGWLLSEDSDDSAPDRRARARAFLRSGEYEACLNLLLPFEKTADDEELLLLSIAAWRLCERALGDEKTDEALKLARQALDFNRRSLYELPTLQIRAAGAAARCCCLKGSGADEAVNDYRDCYQKLQTDVGYHLLLARRALELEHIQAAEREIWSIADLPEENRAEYLILRGRIALKKEQLENAVLYLQQAEEIPGLPKLLRRELYKSLEACFRGREDYKLAYEYVQKQLEL